MKNEKYLYSSINIVSMVLDNIQQLIYQATNQSKLSIILLSTSDKFSTCLNWH